MNVGMAGIGFMGWIHYLAYQKTEKANLTAIQSRSAEKLEGDWTGIKGNFGPPATKVDTSKLAKYREFENLIEDPSLDLIDICLPPNMHAEAAVAALKAGKHVLCEKPMALTTDECDAMLAAADESGKLLMIAHVLPFNAEYAYAREIIDSGQYGNLLGGRFLRVISDPTWLADFYNPAVAGGPLVDLHVHDAHLIRMLFGMPTAVQSVGRMRGEVVEYCDTLFEFDDPSLVVSSHMGVIHQQGRGFTHGFELHLERATLQYELAVLSDGTVETMPIKLFDPNGEVIRPELPAGDDVTGFVGEIEEAARSVESGEPSPILSGELASDAIVLCHKQTEAVRSRRRVEV